MKVPLRWLQEFIDLPTTDPGELEVVLTMLGLEVEGIEVLEPGWTDVVVGRVDGISEHPDADKIRLCQVDTGDGPEQIVCGAWNFGEGAYVAVARPGAELPGGLEIGQRTIRGVTSNGMICSEKELGLGEDHAGILVLDGEPSLGVQFAQLVELPDLVFDIAITPNRPDAMSLLGVARDLSARYGIPYRVPERPLPTTPGSPLVKVDIEDPVGCRRFTAREIRGVTVGPSPLWVRHRLTKAGIRPISNVVDVTNYVMLELGQPLHAFDTNTISGNHLTVKRAGEDETLVTLDGETRRLSPEDLIIYDDAGPTSMSGTMGGERSEVSAGTRNVLMEAASWDPPTIMFMSRRHGLLSEASTRFERGVDPDLTDRADARAAAMVVELAGGQAVEEAIDEVATRIGPVEVILAISEVERLLGPGFSRDEVADILGRLGMAVEGDDPMRVTVPTYRPDLTRPADLVEEVARLHGYDQFGSTVPTGGFGGLTPEQRRARTVNQALAGIGLHQVVTLPFVSEADLLTLGWPDMERLLRVTNPLRAEEGTLRPTMLAGLLGVARYNVSHGASSISIFEAARVFAVRPSPDDPRLPAQPTRLSWVIVGEVGPRLLGAGTTRSDVDVSLSVFRHLMTALRIEGYALEPGGVPGFHPGRTASVSLDGVAIGYVGELSPRATREFGLPGRVAIAEIDLPPLLATPPRKVAVAPSVFPHVDFDLSFVVPADLTAGSLLQASTDAGSGLVESAEVFDEFRGSGVAEGERALAIRYRLRSSDHTLTNEEVAPVREAMIAAVEALGATLRGA